MEYLSFGVELINNLKVHKFSLLCEQILLGLTEGKEISALFTVQEHKKLQTMFSLHPNKLNMLLDAIIYVFNSLLILKPWKPFIIFSSRVLSIRNIIQSKLSKGCWQPTNLTHIQCCCHFLFVKWINYFQISCTSEIQNKNLL